MYTMHHVISARWILEVEVAIGADANIEAIMGTYGGQKTRYPSSWCPSRWCHTRSIQYERQRCPQAQLRRLSGV